MADNSPLTVAIARESLILLEGAIIERLRRHSGIQLDPLIANSGLLYFAKGRDLMAQIYRQYLNIGYQYRLPIIMLTPTWRANPERLVATKLETAKVNQDAFEFLNAIRRDYDDYASKIFIGGLMGCRGDAYLAQEALTEEAAFDFHRIQALSLCQTGVDFLLGATLPALSEAIGLARSMALTGCTYLLSFVLGSDGNLLDGNTLPHAMKTIDEAASPPPLGYLINCVHPLVLNRLLACSWEHEPVLRKRLLGLQGNTSTRSPEELDGLAELESEDPEYFAAAMVNLHRDFGLKLLGGCCGTDERHIKELARVIHKDLS